jgi:hypothetical protein
MPEAFKPKTGLRILSILGILVLTGFTLFYLLSL